MNSNNKYYYEFPSGLVVKINIQEKEQIDRLFQKRKEKLKKDGVIITIGIVGSIMLEVMEKYFNHKQIKND